MEQNVAHLSSIERLWAWFEANKKQVLTGTATVVVVGGAVSFYLWYQGEKEAGASEDLSVSMAPLALGGAGKAQTPDAFLKVAAAHPGTAAAGRAELQAAAGLFMQGKYGEAQAQFERFLRENPESPFGGQAQYGVAVCLDALGKTDEAARSYKMLAERRPNDNVALPAKLALARIYERQNQTAQAGSLYEEIERANPGSSLAAEAALHLEGLRARNPAPAPAPAAAVLSEPLTAPAAAGTNATKP